MPSGRAGAASQVFAGVGIPHITTGPFRLRRKVTRIWMMKLPHKAPAMPTCLHISTPDCHRFRAGLCPAGGVGPLSPPSAILLVATFIVTLGCSPASSEPSAKPSAADSQPAGASPADDADTEIALGITGPRDFWYAAYLLGKKAGYEHTRVEPARMEGRRVLEVTGENVMQAERAGTHLEIATRYRSHETMDGRLLDFQLEMHQGGQPVVTSGRVADGRLVLETAGARTTEMPVPENLGGFFALQSTLLRKPLQPGMQRRVAAFLPAVNVVGVTTLRAEGFEATELPGGSRRLLKVATQTELPNGVRLDGAIWCDRTGLIWKQSLATMQMETVLTTRELATGDSDERPDLITDIEIPLAEPLDSPRSTRRVTYRLHSEQTDPATLPADGPTQKVAGIDPHTAELVVTAIGPDTPLAGETPSPPTEADLRPNAWIQCEAPQIVQAAQSAVDGASDPWEQARRLERWVHDAVEEKGYSVGFADALHVLRTKEGDCTEHAVLLAALARAQGIPARVAVGLVYHQGAFCYHMWNELYVGGRWIPMDATQGQGGIGADHIKLGHANLEGPAALAAMLPVLRAIGDLQIEVVSVE